VARSTSCRAPELSTAASRFSTSIWVSATSRYARRPSITENSAPERASPQATASAVIKVAGPTDAILYEPKNHRLYVTHDEGTDLWVIDPQTARVLASVTIPGVPEAMVYDPSTDRIYLNIKTMDVVAVIDPSTNGVIAQWPTAPATRPHGLALDVASHRVFSAGANGKLVAIDTGSGAASGSIDITPKVDQIALDVGSGLLYCAGTDRMSVVRVSDGTLSRLGELATAPSARNVAVDPATRAVWTTYSDGKSSFAKGWRAP
jgi:YVTN family beta-propeller protein